MILNPRPAAAARPPGITAGRLMKRVVIMGAVHQKIKIAQVARELDVSRSWASREVLSISSRENLFASILDVLRKHRKNPAFKLDVN